MADENQPIIIKKKKAAHAGPHGGAWKLAYADFVTAMMAFFLVMWIIGMDVKTKSGLAEYFSNPGAFKVDFKSSPHMIKLDGRPASQQVQIEATQRELTNLEVEAAEQLSATISSTLDAEGILPRMAANLSIKLTEKGLRIDIMESGPTGTIFETNTATLKPEGRRLLQAITPRLMGAKKGISIEGYVSTKIPSADRWDVSLNRANSARREMAAIGLKSSDLLTVSGMGDTNFKVPDNPQAPANDRISILIPMDK